jgi:hypothetical protein
MTQEPDKTGRAQRLRRARVEAGFARGADAVERFGWNRNTYKSNENGAAPFSFDQAKAYAAAFDVRAEWLYDGTAPIRPGVAIRRAPPKRKPRLVPVVGYVGAGSRTRLYAEGQGPLDRVDGPDDANDKTVAVEIRGESLGAFFRDWLVFYDDVRSPVTPDLHHKLCVVGLKDGHILLKQIKPSRTQGLFILLSQTEDPLLDQVVTWAAAVTSMRPR